MPVLKVSKRDGSLVVFNKEKISGAIFNAAYAVGGSDKDRADHLADIVVKKVNEKYGDEVPTVEDIQDLVERVLIEEHHIKTAKAYILYREKKTRLRELKKSLVGTFVAKKLSYNALKILKERYLMKDENGAIAETPLGMFRRVAHNVAKADKIYNDFDPKKSEEIFNEAMDNLYFLPNSPTLMNAGTQMQQLSACFVLPIEDSIESIYMALRNAAIIHQSGGGTGFSFSGLRPKGDIIGSTRGPSSGPKSFIELFDKSTEIIKKGGRRRGANMGVLRVDHPDVLDFINAKENTEVLTNFNLSVGLTSKFIQALKRDNMYDLINPKTGEVVRKLPAREVFDLIATMAWKNGEPGILFLDTINKENPLASLGEIKTTNPCGEVPLLPYESCNLGSINLYHMVEGKEVDYEKLRKTVWLAIHFLDNVIEMNKYPLKEIETITKANRKIGLGVMGFSDMLYRLGIKYDSEEGLKFAEKLIGCIYEEAKKASIELAKRRGVFTNWKKSKYVEEGIKLRNGTLLSIAPTGTLSMIADCSGSIEPNFALSYIKRVMGGEEFLFVNKHFADVARERGFYSEELMKKIANKGSIQSFREIPKDVRDVFVTSHDISAEYHVRMQAAFQKHVDNAVSKSVNLRYTAQKDDMANIFKLAHELGCKGITVYRDGSRDNQVLNVEYDKNLSQKQERRIVKKRRVPNKCETC